MLGGPLCKNQQYVSHKKYFVPSWGTNVCCQKDLSGKVAGEILNCAVVDVPQHNMAYGMHVLAFSSAVPAKIHSMGGAHANF